MFSRFWLFIRIAAYAPNRRPVESPHTSAQKYACKLRIMSRGPGRIEQAIGHVLAHEPRRDASLVWVGASMANRRIPSLSRRGMLVLEASEA